MFDLIVLGGGPGGYLAAERAGHAGLSVLLIEKNKLGGTCLNEGCIPSKTLLNSAKFYEHAKHGAVFGVSAENVKIDQTAVVKRKDKVVRKLVAGVGMALKSANVKVVEGAGEIIGKDAASGEIRVKVGAETHAAKRLVIATGSEASAPPIPGLREGMANGTILTNREILNLREIPETLAVIGGGVIGLEMASYFQTVGSQVTVIEMLGHIAGPSDREMAALLQKSFEAKGIKFCLNAKVTSVGDGVVNFEINGVADSIKTSACLSSVGRRPIIEGFGLETLGVHTERGRIVVDEQCQTNVPGVYAVGDVNGVYMLAHAAYREAEVAVNSMLGKKDAMRYDAVPSVVYTNPEMGAVGETEETCIAKGIEFKKVVLPMSYSGRWLAENEGAEGKIKLLADMKKQRLLGCHIVGSYASEIILAAGMMIGADMRLDRIKEIVFPHPTVGEIIREAVFQL
ncbi:MAG: dihydrolipoyl dehydrogenase [Kiritimatiellaeota bacterium]|nr:dihydrolipoyl dehydrogenase [Kiritimatiellota bacterium]